MQTARKQQGMTLIGWLLVLMLAAIVAVIALKLIPVYLDGYKVYQSVSSLAEDASAQGKNAAELRKLLMRRLKINMVFDVKDDDITFTREGTVTVLEVDYEARRQLFGNLYAVVVFQKRVEIK